MINDCETTIEDIACTNEMVVHIQQRLLAPRKNFFAMKLDFDIIEIFRASLHSFIQLN